MTEEQEQKLKKAFEALLDTIGEVFPDGGDLPIKTQLAVISYLTKISILLGIEIDEEGND